MNRAETKERKSRYSIKWGVYALLIGFIIVILAIIWFFQIQMLTYFYQANKFNELKNVSLEISSELENTDNYDQAVENNSQEYTEDIWVCKIVDGEPVIAKYVPSTGESVNQMIAKNFDSLYKTTAENGGSYIALVSDSGRPHGTRYWVVKDNYGNSKSFPYIRGGTGKLHAVSATLKTVRGDTFMIVQSTALTPVAAVSGTLKNQFLCIGIILSIAALLAAGYVSKTITKPIVKLNNAAKCLAKGEYNADFSAQGYREIEELAGTLEYASKELAKTDNLQKELISNVSHDLRTPLTMIKGYGELMRDIPGENTPENIQIIIDETSRLSELVNDMLDLSRIQSGTRAPQNEVFSLTAIVRETMQRYERLTMQDGYKIEFSYEGDARVNADRGMILQVVYNLINNAINYTGDDKSVIVKQTLTDNSVKISVIDTGDGIPEDKLEAIWDRYYKVDKVHRRATVGTGLGLSIVKQILELHGAGYGVESKVGEGSEFWFELARHSVNDISADQGFIEADYESGNDGK